MRKRGEIVWAEAAVTSSIFVCHSNLAKLIESRDACRRDGHMTAEWFVRELYEIEKQTLNALDDLRDRLEHMKHAELSASAAKVH